MFLNLFIDKTSSGFKPSENRFWFGGYMDEEIWFRQIFERFVKCLDEVFS